MFMLYVVYRRKGQGKLKQLDQERDGEIGIGNGEKSFFVRNIRGRYFKIRLEKEKRKFGRDSCIG